MFNYQFWKCLVDSWVSCNGYLWVPFSFFFFKLFYNIVNLQWDVLCLKFTHVYNVVFKVYSKVIHYTYTYINSFSDSYPIYVITEYWASFLCHTVGPCWWSVLYTVVYIFVNPKFLIYPSPCISILITINFFLKFVNPFLFNWEVHLYPFCV